MINEYERWGFSKFRKLFPFLQILGACGIYSSYINIILIISSLGFLMMFSAIIFKGFILMIIFLESCRDNILKKVIIKNRCNNKEPHVTDFII